MKDKDNLLETTSTTRTYKTIKYALDNEGKTNEYHFILFRGGGEAGNISLFAVSLQHFVFNSSFNFEKVVLRRCNSYMFFINGNKSNEYSAIHALHKNRF